MTSKPASPFKLGETYPTRGHSERKVIYIGQTHMIVLDDSECPTIRRLDGRALRKVDGPYDLMPRTKQVTRWLNIYSGDVLDDPGRHTILWSTKDLADNQHAPGRIACVEVKFTIPDDQEFPGRRYLDGRVRGFAESSSDLRVRGFAESSSDLMPRTKQVTRWLNVYADLMGDTPHVTEEQANTNASEGRLACISYTVTIPDDGSGDS